MCYVFTYNQMEFIQKVSPDSVYRFFKLHPIEITLIFLASMITLWSTVLQLQNTDTKPKVLSAKAPLVTPQMQSPLTPTSHAIKNSIFVEVSGAIIEPDVYEVSPGARLKDVIERAGGLSTMADTLYVARNYNLAKFVGDQEKIYIPYTWDIINGTFVEQKRILEYLQPLYSTNSSTALSTVKDPPPQSSLLTISINESSKEELETLSGVGPVTAQKIIDNRPYLSLDELISKKVINSAALEKIKNNIDL